MEPFRPVFPALRASWKDLRKVQQSAREHRSKWLHERADDLASQMKTDRSKAVRQIAAENATKTMFRRIRPISKGTQSGAITRVKVPVHTWYYSPTGDELLSIGKGRSTPTREKAPSMAKHLSSEFKQRQNRSRRITSIQQQLHH